MRRVCLRTTPIGSLWACHPGGDAAGQGTRYHRRRLLLCRFGSGSLRAWRGFLEGEPYDEYSVGHVRNEHAERAEMLLDVGERRQLLSVELQFDRIPVAVAEQSLERPA